MKIKAQLNVPLADFRSEVPQNPKWGVKQNSKRSTSLGYKVHLILGSTSQYILDSLFLSGSLKG